MNENENGKTAAKSVLVIEFQSPGSAEFGMKTENVTPAQMLAAAAWLHWFALKSFDAAAVQQAQARPGLLVPQMVGMQKRQ